MLGPGAPADRRELRRAEERLALGIKDTLIRFAIGIEGAADLIADLDQALAT